MTIYSPEANNIARGRSPRAILPVEGEQIVLSPSPRANIVLLYRYTDDTIILLSEKQYYHTIVQHLKKFEDFRLSLSFLKLS